MKVAWACNRGWAAAASVPVFDVFFGFCVEFVSEGLRIQNESLCFLDFGDFVEAAASSSLRKEYFAPVSLAAAGQVSAVNPGYHAKVPVLQIICF